MILEARKIRSVEELGSFRLRGVDVQECDIGGMTPMEAITRSIEASLDSWSVWDGNRLVMVCGYMPQGFIGSTVRAWCLTTMEVYNMKVWFARASRRFVTTLLDRYTAVEVYVWNRHELAIKWLKWLGFSYKESDGDFPRYEKGTAMGFLAPIGMAIAPEIGAMMGGTAAAGAAGASTAAAASLGTSALSTAASMGGSIFSGISGYQQNMFQAKLAGYNSQLALQEKNASLTAGQTAEEQDKMKTGKLIGEETANQGAGGIDVGGGSAVGVRESTQLAGDFDAATIRYNAARQAYGYGQQAFADQLQAQQDKNAAIGSLVGGVLGAGTNFVSGAAQYLGQVRTVPDDRGAHGSDRTYGGFIRVEAESN